MSSIFCPLVYPDIRRDETEPSGVYVEMHVSHASHEAVHNVETATILAKPGVKVLLLPLDNTPHVKNPDACLIDEDITIEFKHNSTPTASAIENEVRGGKKQADYILIHVMSNITKGDLLRGLNTNLHRAKTLKEIWIIVRKQRYRFTQRKS